MNGKRFAWQVRGVRLLGASCEGWEVYQRVGGLGECVHVSLCLSPQSSTHNPLPKHAQPPNHQSSHPKPNPKPQPTTAKHQTPQPQPQGVCLLPFIEEERLLAAVAPLEDLLSPEEKYRNSTRTDLFYVHSAHPLGAVIMALFERLKGLSDEERASQVSVLGEGGWGVWGLGVGGRGLEKWGCPSAGCGRRPAAFSRLPMVP